MKKPIFIIRIDFKEIRKELRKNLTVEELKEAFVDAAIKAFQITAEKCKLNK